MGTWKKYNFETNFSDKDGNIIVPEVIEAKKEGHQQGHLAGHAQALKEIESHTALALEKISATLQDLVTDQQQAYSYINHHVLTLTQAIAEKVIPYLLEKGAEEEIKAFVEMNLKKIKPKGVLVITVHPDLKEIIQDHITAVVLKKKDSYELTIQSDETFNHASIDMNWDDGGIRRCVDHIWDDVNQAIKEYKSCCDAPPNIEKTIEKEEKEAPENAG